MNPKRNAMELIVICGILVLLSILGLIWDLSSRLLFSGIDGLLLLFVCLLVGGVFSLEMYFTARKFGLIGSLKPFRRKAGEDETSPKGEGK